MSQSGQALVNEYKGNLFEYLVAVEIANAFGLKSSFELSLTHSFTQMLSVQQQFLFINEKVLYKQLPLMAKKCALELIAKLKITDFNKVTLCGKTNRADESDIIITTQFQEFPVSIKLAKKGSYVNCKSAGLKSFLTRYFDSASLQQLFNAFLEDKYTKFAYDIHARNDIEWNGSFDVWRDKGLPELPGKLSDPDKKYLHALYSELIQRVYRLLMEIKESRPQIFHQGIRSLLGNSQDDLVTLTCFHSNNYSQFYSDIDYNSMEEELFIEEPKALVASLQLHSSSKSIMLRVKPMNTFTQMSFKLNCAYKALN